MNIAIISYIYPRKRNPSQGIFVHQQAKYLVRAGHSVDVITTRSEGDKKLERKDGVTAHRVMSIDLQAILAGFVFIFKTLTTLIKINKKKKIDVVIGEFLGSTTILVGILLKILRIKFVVISHGTKWEIRREGIIPKTLIRTALLFPEKIICVSNKTKELLSYNVRKDKLYVVNNGMDPEFLKPNRSKEAIRKQLKIKKNDVLLLSVSNLVIKKGIEVILRALSEIEKKHPNFVYVAVGDGYDREKFENLAKELGLEDKVRFVGRKVGSDLANLYQACDFFVLMSRDIGGEIESFGIAYIEAAYFGKAVVGGISGGTADAVADGKTGFLVNSKNQKKVEETILKLIKDEKLRENLGKAGKKRVHENFLWKHNVEKLMKTIKQ